MGARGLSPPNFTVLPQECDFSPCKCVMII